MLDQQLARPLLRRFLHGDFRGEFGVLVLLGRSRNAPPSSWSLRLWKRQAGQGARRRRDGVELLAQGECAGVPGIDRS